VETNIQGMQTVVTNLYNDKLIISADVYKGLMDKLQAAAEETSRTRKINQLNAFNNLVKAQSGKKITKDTAELLITDVSWLIQPLP
jgi:hypothetical protein